MFKRALITILLFVAIISLSTLVKAADSTKSAFASTTITSRYVTVPVGTIVAWPQTAALPSEADPKWRECDGRSVPRDSDLYKQKGMGATPNLYAGNGYFIRASSNPRNMVADTFRSHNHGQPSHVHNTTGGLTSTAVTTKLDSTAVAGRLDDTSTSGTAQGQRVGIPGHSHNISGQLLYQSWVGGTTGGWGMPYDVKVSIGSTTYSGIATHVMAESSTTTGKVNNGNVTSNVVNAQSKGDVDNRETTGTAHESGGDDTYYTGDSETAPMHFTSRYFIRIND